MKILSWNVNGIRAQVAKNFYQTIDDLHPDILCIQETKAQQDTLPDLTGRLHDYSMIANSAIQKGYSGTAVLTKVKPIEHTLDLGVVEHDQEGRVITLEFDDFFLVNVYVPNSGQDLKRLNYRKTWDLELLQYVSGLDLKKPVILTGDLNVAHERIDLARPDENYNKSAGFTQTEIDGFKAFLQAGFTDVYRKFHPEKIQYTYWSMRFRAREKNLGWRIDYFLVSERLLPRVKKVEIYDQVMGSDHCPVGLELKL
jgi:exodeoxyribonuclease-3